MNKRCSEIVTVLTVILIVSACVALSRQAARYQSMHFHIKKAQALADEVIRHTDDTAAQLRAATTALAPFRQSGGCSAQEIALMRKLQISASYLQGVGRIEHNHLMCSSHGDHGAGYDLGPVDFVGSQGASVRVSARLPIAPQTAFIIVETEGYAGIVHPALVFEVPSFDDDMALALVNTTSGKLIASRGALPAAAFAPLAGALGPGAWREGAISARRPSASFDVTAVAMISQRAVDASARVLGIWMMPLGLLAGCALAWGLFVLLRRQVSVPALMRSALRRGEFFVEYQPVVSLENRQCVGAEALLRWRRQDGTLVRPDLFIPIAEACGLIGPVTRRMLALVEADLPGLLEGTPELHISVNLSPHDMGSAELARTLGAAAQRSGIAQGKLVVEVTERGLMDVNLATTVIQELRAAGIGVAIDDFGTGYSCLSYLSTLNVDYLKIDKSFIDSIGTAAPTNNVVPHIIAMARSLHLKMIAEGVETTAQADYLRQHGVQFAQGWLFARSMNASDFQRYLAAQAAVRARNPDRQIA
jgi:sensor c-di-GMP phosphodiesterase-like protein